MANSWNRLLNSVLKTVICPLPRFIKNKETASIFVSGDFNDYMSKA